MFKFSNEDFDFVEDNIRRNRKFWNIIQTRDTFRKKEIVDCLQKIKEEYNKI